MLTWLCSGTVLVLSMLTVLTSECQLSRLELLLLSFFFNQELVLVLYCSPWLTVLTWSCSGCVHYGLNPFNINFYMYDPKMSVGYLNL